MRSQSIEKFKATVMEILEWAQLHPEQDDGQCHRLNERTMPGMRCDIALLRRDRSGISTVIVCDLGSDIKSLTGNLGRVLLCRNMFAADHALICLPSNATPLRVFVEACAGRGVRVCSDEGILGTLADLGVVDPDIAFRHKFMRWLQRPPGSAGMLAYITAVHPPPVDPAGSESGCNP